MILPPRMVDLMEVNIFVTILLLRTFREINYLCMVLYDMAGMLKYEKMLLNKGRLVIKNITH